MQYQSESAPLSQLSQDQRASLLDGSAYSLMVGAGETYLPAFALALGFSGANAGLLASLPLIAGAILQLITPKGVRWARSCRRWVVGCAVAQALCFVPLALVAWRGACPGWVLFAIVSLYWASGMALVPAWNTWMGALVPRAVRTAFFSHRSQLAQLSTLLGIVLGGLYLEHHSGGPLERRQAFVVLFAAAACFRLLSSKMLARQSEPEKLSEQTQPLRLGQLRQLLQSNRRLDGALSHILLFYVGVYVSAPYFAPWMLRELELSYTTYMALLGVSYLSKALCCSLLRPLISRKGAYPMLYASALGVAVVPVLWVFGRSVPYLALVQLFSGLLWAAQELSSFLLLLEEVPDAQRTNLMTCFGLLNTSGQVIGALLGGLFLQWQGCREAAYLTLFVVSGLLRLLSLGWLAMPRRGRVSQRTEATADSAAG